MSGWKLADHVWRHHVVAGVPVLAVLFQRGLTAQVGGHAQRVGVGDAGEQHLNRAGVEDDSGAVCVPPGSELGFAVRDWHELDALAARVG